MKKILIAIIILGAIYFILALFGPKQIVVSREININSPASLVKEKMGDLKFFHEQWSPWTEKDPNMKTSYEGTPGQVGHLYAWSGNKEVGEGTMKISAINGDTTRYDLSYGNKGDAVFNLIASENGTSTLAKWQMILEISFFGRTPMLFMNMDKMMGPDFEKGLSKLKTVLESNKSEKQTTHYEIKEIKWPETNYIGSKKEIVELKDLSMFFGKQLPAVFEGMAKNKVQAQSAPSAIYFSYDQAAGKTEVAAVAQAPMGGTVKGFENYLYPACTVLHICYYGDYTKSESAHLVMDKYMKEKGQTQNGVIEEYVTDPLVEKDTAKWLTNIYYIIK